LAIRRDGMMAGPSRDDGFPHRQPADSDDGGLWALDCRRGDERPPPSSPARRSTARRQPHRRPGVQMGANRMGDPDAIVRSCKKLP
jgi:hypothetical protein